MEIFKEILVKALHSEEMVITFPNLQMDVNQIVEAECYKMLMEIRDILADYELDDPECFMRIEKIVCLFQSKKISVGVRHDF